MGVTKEYLAETMDMLEGFMWIADYDPSDYYPYRIIEDKEENDADTVAINSENSLSSVVCTLSNTYYLQENGKKNTQFVRI